MSDKIKTFDQKPTDEIENNLCTINVHTVPNNNYRF